jgi:sigma-B regulation protein RsbU (phosphoserine phosphatase)
MKTARPQLVLLALVAIASLTYYIASVSSTLVEVYGDRVPRNPTYHGFHLRAASGVRPEAQDAGVHWGDPIVAINGRPFTGYNVLLDELRKSHAGDLMKMTILPNGPDGKPARAHDVDIHLAPVYATRPGALELLGRIFFLNAIFPLGCLVLGVWVVAARPRDINAWLLFGILEYFVAIFAGNQFWPGALFGFMSIWTVLMMVVGPLSIMFFGIYFPERSATDIRFPWIKWVLSGVLLALLPAVLLFNLGFAFSFQTVGWLAPWIGVLTRVITIFAMIAIGIYFYCLGQKAGTATSADVKRRLRILYTGSTVGNAPLFFLVIYSVSTGKDLGVGVPPWLFLAALSIFTLFPISLAYVVVVHRAMDLRILVRQGTKYALARTSLWFIRALTGILLGLAVMHAVRHHPLRLVDIVLLSACAALLLVVRYRTTKSLSLWIDRKFFREAYSTEQVLSELATRAQSFTETPPLIRTVSESISNALHIDRIAVLIRSGDTFRLQYATGIDAGSNVLLPGNSKTITNLDTVRTPANVYLDNPDSWLLAATDSERAALRELGAELLIPLRGRSRLLGIMALGPKRSEEPYSRSDRGLLQSVALHTGLSIENSELMHSLANEAAQRERINREIEVAREVQERFLPQSYPAVTGIELAGGYRAAQSVGGDYYDFIEMRSEGGKTTSLGIAIGDISGKGISAALLMASLRASLRSLTRNSDGDLAAMMREVNELVYEASASNRYATFFFAQLDPASRRMSYVNAGHNPPAVVRRNGKSEAEIIRLEAGGPVIGLMERCDYVQSELTMQPGDILVAFTDGISEAMNHDEEEWSEERLIDCLACCPEMPAAALVKCLMEAADEFAAGAPQHDDMTLLILKVMPTTGGLPGSAPSSPQTVRA